ncbi:MAG TPA: hypothetical protein ENI23_01810 [bacterium]|nr:hypothetical protein [bacterium]
MRIVIDIDGTICEEKPTFERVLAKPLNGAISSIKTLKDQGHFIILYTARGWAEYEMTYLWLTNRGIPFDVLLMGKPIYDVWIDDRAIKFTSWKDINV